jgi:two-component system chemotaxis sensor kinase CheA
LDVVQSKVEALHGTVDVTFEPGRGTCFALHVPLTLTTIRTVLAETSGRTYAVPTASVRQIARLRADQVRVVSGRDCLMLRGKPTPLAGLADALGLKSRPAPRADALTGLVLAVGEQQVCFLVDAVLAEQEVVVKRLGSRIRRARHVSGATLLPSGRVALVLNVGNLVRTALGRLPAQSVQPAPLEAAPRHRLLVVEDTITTRALLKSILEFAGYDVSVAADGRQAWQMLPEGSFDLVISDVEMPNLDGFELTATIRRSPALADLPVILVTARTSDQDKARGVQVGANAYLVKTGFDQQNLLKTIRQLL